MKRIVIAVWVVVLALAVVAWARSPVLPTSGSVEEAAAAVDLEAAKVAVNSVLDQWIQVVDNENLELFSKLMAHDPDMVSFGTDAAERWVGYQSLESSMEKQFESTEESKAISRERVITVHKSGEVAWWSELYDMTGKAQGEAFALEGMRLTGVLEKRNGNWVIVQFHGSVPVSGQAIKY